MYTTVGATQLAFDIYHLKQMDILGALKVGLPAEVVPTSGRGSSTNSQGICFCFSRWYHYLSIYKLIKSLNK